MSPPITVIVPNYNHARFLPRRIDSILNQTVSDIEVILLDDCSSDESRDVLNAYAERDSRVRTCFNEVNSGSTFKQWGLVIGIARGAYVWIAESDDWAEPELLARLAGVLDRDPDAAIAFCDSVIHFEDVGEEMLASEYLRSRVPESDRWFARDGSPAALADAVGKVLQDTHLAETLAANCRGAVVEHWRWEDAVARLEDHLSEVAAIRSVH